ncbi:ATPase [Chryseotalea sanaruensis]|uniref:ATPase n=1 Tax=Chryseotalea sanaruensis TaxID=2482724 RepID=A0A401UBY0_9BACT|nr:heavy metal translocating P-type ATPase metal-binding domain-containing protein [Chryseotalea sanaruensis]GCC52382.1 ATPase [Chryseotalea sanaruensis]
MSNSVVEESPASKITEKITCYHCGQDCEDEILQKNGKNFCCYGCQTVYDILNENNLCEYYTYDTKPGLKHELVDNDAFAYLDEKGIKDKLLLFQSATFAKVEFYVPAIHCISCLWLLENLQRLCTGVLRSQVNFARKRVTIEFDPSQISLSTIAARMTSVGYAPLINLENSKSQKETHPLIAKLSVAGFAFGNIMLLSFPEYLGLDASEQYLQQLFSYLNIALSVPVLIYSSSDYFKNTWTSIQQKQINIDVPIAIGLAALFFRSTYDILFHIGPGYFDSFSGLVFFLLIGRWFQDKTYESLAFDRDYKSYFPLAIHKQIGVEWKPVVVYDLECGDVIKVRNIEVVPTDATLLSEQAYIDYSFVTGESKPVKANVGDLVYAGGRLLGEPVILEVQKKTSQSHLTSLWNNAVFQKPKESRYKKMIDKAARGFTWFVLFFSIATAVYWYYADSANMWLILTSVLIVACPCALALAAPFTYGNMLRVFGKHGFYLKNADVIERMAGINALVFDKTGTITQGAATVHFEGDLTQHELSCIKSLAASSVHPMSELIVKHLTMPAHWTVKNLIERPGKGIEGEVACLPLKIGSANFVGANALPDQTSSHVFVSVSGEVKGHFTITTALRNGIKQALVNMNALPVAMLSGDNESDKLRMKQVFPASAKLLFHQSPQDKMNFIQDWKAEGKQVMMLGDGLNDAGALKQSDVGISISDNAGVFTPACDGILQGSQLTNLALYLRLAKASTTILKAAFAISFFYNIISLSFAVTGYLTPLVAAILMPISSISVVGFSSIAVGVVSRSILKKSV